MIAALHDAAHFWLAAHAAAMRDHIAVSTVVLAVLLALSLIPSLRPRTRHALVFLGVAKFLLPGAVLVDLAARVTGHTIVLPPLPMTATFTVRASTSSPSEVLCVLSAVWLIGAIAIAFRVIAVQKQWHRTVCSATAASRRETEAMLRVADRATLRGVPRIARSSTGIPMTAGFLRPVVLLPEACAERLNDDELTAVLAHEVAHVERRHNLAAIVQNITMALFWFDPALWIAKARLHIEAEKDCDERVLHFVPDPPTYLSGMLKVSYGFIAPLPAGVSCMSTSQLKERTDHLMKHHHSNARSFPHRLAIAIGIAAVIGATMFASAGPPPPPSAPAAPAADQKDGITQPKLVTRVEPTYPPSAREKKIQGTVIVAASIDKQGTVTAVSIVQGVEGEEGKALGDAASAAVKQWKFEPALKNGKPVATTFKITVRFKLS